MATLDDLSARQSDQAGLLEELAVVVRSLAGQFGDERRAALEDRLQERLPDDRRTLSPKQSNIGSTVLGNATPYDLFPGLAANWTFIYHADGRLDSAWRTGDEGAASIVVHWDSTPRVILVQVSRGGRHSELRLVWSAGLVVALSRSFVLMADSSSDEYLAYFGLNESRVMAGTFAATPTADYLAVEFM